MNRGQRLVRNDTIGIVAPSSFALPEKIAAAVSILKDLGYQVRLGASCESRWHSFSGNDQLRAGDINDFFADPEIDALICLRGGYGSLRLLDKIDYELVKENPKIFMGYSDITLLHQMFNQRSDLITFHGPMLTTKIVADFSPPTRESFEAAVCEGFTPYTLLNPPGETIKSLNGGLAEGRIAGGNLLTIISSLGTPYEPDLADKILFIEDTGEATYRIDRALSQLLLSGKLHQVTGIIIGDFNDCLPAAPEDMDLMEVFNDRLCNLGIPIIYNFRSGHCNPMMTLPLGTLARIDGNDPRIEILEQVVG